MLACRGLELGAAVRTGVLALRVAELGTDQADHRGPHLPYRMRPTCQGG
ncbi:Hypothetical protein AA314_03442 [Archangium gephyra]|uniref:Uncharacterized protein n=1 Tax=Archangium gephyra TaxID=48 RepID=A0AAC8TER8_9BACT|nr:Hypothetical protein AA314_03442 [Archangium gephyra]